MRGQRDKRAAEEAKAARQAVQIIDVSEHEPRRIPSAKWRELIKKVWEADPLLCPRCQKEMRIVSLILTPALRLCYHFYHESAPFRPVETGACPYCPKSDLLSLEEDND